jgi:hypothetical protein
MGPLLVWALGLCTYRTPLEPALARPCLVFACTRRTDPARRRRNSFLPAEELRQAHGRTWTWPWMATAGVEFGGDEKEHQRKKIRCARPCLVFACTRRTDPARRRRNSFLPAAWRGAYALGCLSLSPPSAMDPQRAQCGRVAASADLASSRRKECYAGRRGGCAAGQGHSRRRVESQERASGEGRVPRRMRSA